MLAKADQGNILKVIFPRKVDCVLWTNIAQVIPLSNIVSRRI